MGGYENGDSLAAVAGEDGVVLGVDGGTTNTVCVCLPAAMPQPESPAAVPVLARAVAGSSNRNSVGESAALETLEQVMTQALAMANTVRSAVRAVCLAVSGVNHPSDQQRMLEWIRDLFPGNAKFYVENDAVAALASGTMGKLHGCVLIAGTGSIAYGVTEDGKVARAAGAGPVLGDWGRWTYADPSWARIAALVPVVVSSAEDGDEVANKILHDSVQELADTVIAVVRRLRLCGEEEKDKFPLVLVGGVLEGNKKWDISGEVIKCISKVFPGTNPIWPEVEPAIGAALLAWSHHRKGLKLENGS
ncbi:hypothetical protein GQ55_6G024400 [Panicum hallii var. hallii]|uniref:N-acetyl-D-glucosamine kinase n=1 Tax=Panicum hallii var. hallii TaxID=1504633 RepID=A0A2T7D372_9POAL|nr:hypothetical protein GQ55_6G024400 [Panicum hallii var. hallii]